MKKLQIDHLKNQINLSIIPISILFVILSIGLFYTSSKSHDAISSNKNSFEFSESLRQLNQDAQNIITNIENLKEVKDEDLALNLIEKLDLNIETFSKVNNKLIETSENKSIKSILEEIVLDFDLMVKSGKSMVLASMEMEGEKKDAEKYSKTIEKLLTEIRIKLKLLNRLSRHNIDDKNQNLSTFFTNLQYTSFFTIIIFLFLLFIISRRLMNLTRTIINNEKDAMKKQIEITEKTLDHANNLMENLSEGFMVFDETGKVEEGCTYAAKKYFGCDPTGLLFPRILQLNEDETKKFNDLLETVNSSVLGFSDLSPLFPKVFEKNQGKYIELDYRAIFNKNEPGKVDKVICIATDKGNEKELERRNEVEKSLVRFIINALKNKEEFFEFVNETRRIFSELQNELDKESSRVDYNLIFRGIHSIKGTTASFHMLDIGHKAHILENNLQKNQDNFNEESNIQFLKRDLFVLATDFEFFLDTHRSILGSFKDSGHKVLSLDKNKIKHLSLLLDKEVKKGSSLYKEISELLFLSPIENLFERFKRTVEDVANLQGKNVKLTINKSPIMVISDYYAPICSSYIHVFRNAVDHGLEEPEEREMLGKPQKGSIEISFIKVDTEKQMVEIIVQDDGRGIDPEIIKNKVIEKQLASEEELSKKTNKEIIQYIFHPGFSTSQEITEISGRGVGLDALKADAVFMGGVAWVESEIGKGSLFHVKLPLITSYLEEK